MKTRGLARRVAGAVAMVGLALLPFGAPAEGPRSGDVTLGLDEGRDPDGAGPPSRPDGRLATAAPAAVLVAQAGGAPDAGQPGAWRFTVAPYLWMPETDVTATVGRLSRSIEIEFKDVVEELDFGFIGHFEATKGDWTALADLVYLRIRKGETQQGVRIDFDQDQVMFEFGGTYRLGTVPLGAAGRLTFEALLGGRLLYTDAELGIAGRRASRDATLIDPMIGGRIAYHITDTIGLWVRGDVGGFGISDTQTDLTWNVVAGLNWRVTEAVSLFAGWHVMDIDLEKGSGGRTLDLDMTMSGPMFGVAVAF